MTKEKWQQIFGGKVLQRLGELDMTQSKLARKLGVNIATVNNWITGRHMPDAYFINNLSIVLGVDADWLIRVNELVK